MTLVVIDAKKKQYAFYADKQRLCKIEATELLTSDQIEYYRSNPLMLAIDVGLTF